MEDRLPMLRGRRWTLILVTTVVLCLGIVANVQCRDLVNEVFPRRALVTPVLVMDVDLIEYCVNNVTVSAQGGYSSCDRAAWRRCSRRDGTGR